MKRYTGETVCPGTAVGLARLLKTAVVSRLNISADETEKEWSRLQEAVSLVQEKLLALQEETLSRAGKESAEIFDSYRLLLLDEGYLRLIKENITAEYMSAEQAVYTAGEIYAKRLLAVESEYIRERAADIQIVSRYLTEELCGVDNTMQAVSEPCILVAREISAAEIMSFGTENLLAIAAVNTSVNSHAAILARMLSVPMVTALPEDIMQLSENEPLIVYAESGEVLAEPAEEEIKAAQDKLVLSGLEQEKVAAYPEEEWAELSKESLGNNINIYANAGAVAELSEVLRCKADGIGLLRSEFLFMGRSDYPSEEEQFEVYKQILETMGEKPVVIRTFDLGSDKESWDKCIRQEENPALGCRGIRLSLMDTEHFKEQLRALYRASVYGRLSIMYPMIVSPEEVRRIYEIVAEVKKELAACGIFPAEVRQGIMLETPAAVMLADELAELVDFFSVGTNDLAQYTMAIDRTNMRAAGFDDPEKRAVLRLIRLAAEAAHKAGKQISICGEMAGDEKFAEYFLQMKIDSLSVSASKILHIRKYILKCQRSI